MKYAGATAVGVSIPGCVSVQKRKRSHTNFVIIFTDDQGYADVGSYGAKGFTTPNLDQMGKEGVRFSDFYVSQAVCSASRVSLMTGCYSNRVSILGALFPDDNYGLNPQEDTIADVLRKKGYTSGIFGKWHLGHHKDFLPLAQGFDEYFGIPYSNDMWPVGFDGKPATEGYRTKMPPLPLIDGSEKVDEIHNLEDQSTLTTRYTERAVKFIEKNKDKPFFLYVPHSMPHVPLGVSDKFKDKSEQGMYGDVIMEIDWSVGQILKSLKENGLDDNTLVIFATDNGPWLNFGNHAGSAFPLREGKMTMFEGGARVPCIIRWPGKIKPDTVCKKMASTIDLLPTIAEIAGAPLPEKKIDGVSILPLLKGKNENPRDVFYFYYGNALQAVRQGRWKLHFPYSYRSYNGVEPGKNGYPGSRINRTTELELYDLKNDISEKNNVIDLHGDVVRRLEKLAEKARRELGDSLTERKGQEIRPVGKL
ncbi:MAG: sulfatase [Deltaproteobacteria bacterium]|nr:sulfatase [Deltaproteobacteria bacterium]